MWRTLQRSAANFNSPFRGLKPAAARRSVRHGEETNLMSAILALAAKDLRLLVRVKSGLFFAFAWPLVIAILFGAVFSGSSDSGSRRLAVALADEDQSAGSRDF